MDKETFTRLVLGKQRQLYRIAMSYTANIADAEDAMQECLLRAWDRRETLREPAYFSTWLNRILINECKTLLRKRKHQADISPMPEPTVDPPDVQAMELRRALFSLPEKYRVPLVLNLLEGYTLQETAEMLSLPLGTITTRVARAKKKLRQEVSEDAQ